MRCRRPGEQGRCCARGFRGQSRRHADDRQHHGQGASFGSRRKREAQAQAIGRSRGGRTTKIHAVVDGLGRPLAFEVTPGQLGDVRAATALIGPLPPALFLAADTAYDSDGLRRLLAERGPVPVIPNNPTRKRTHPFNPAAYRQRNAIERMFGRLKDWRRIATRYDKLAANFTAAVLIAAIITWWV
jgi:transposase